MPSSNVAKAKIKAGNRTLVETDNDFYETHPDVVKALLKHENFTSNILECCCGLGAISNVLIDKGFVVDSADLIDRGYGRVEDFLSDKEVTEADMVSNIITNPPYRHLNKFIARSKLIATEKIALLVPTTFLASVGRYDMFQDKEFPLAKIYQFSSRISMYKASDTEKTGRGMIDYCWAIWDKNYTKGNPEIYWIKDTQS